MSDPSESRDERRRPTTRTWLALGGALVAVLVLLVAVAVACGQSGGVGAGDSTSPPAGTGGLGSGATGGGGDGPGPTGSPAAPPGQEDPTGQPAAGPVIEVFEVVQRPRCPGGTTDNPIEGQPVTLRWRVTGADGDRVDLSIDGPGVYDTYPAEGGDVINFSCEGEEGDTQRHTYLLTAVGDGVTVTERLVVTARVEVVTEN
jgi:hypothetical protein